MNNREYDVLPRENNLPMLLPPLRQDESAPPVPITVIVNWTEELKARVPAKPR